MIEKKPRSREVRSKPKPFVPKESEIQKSIIQYLLMRGCKIWRQNTGGMKQGDRFIKFGYRGISDIIGMVPGGRFCAFEVKRPGGKPTEDQQAFIASVLATGGIAGVVTSIEDAQKLLAHFEVARPSAG